MSTVQTSDNSIAAAAQFVLHGHVQGFGVRPAIARLANRLNLAGSVANLSGGVEVCVEGTPEKIAAFARSLPGALPEAATLEHCGQCPADVIGHSGFRIEVASQSGDLTTHVPRDLAVCQDCLNDITKPGDRRSNYPFTSCTNCGPRYSIIERMPYERDDTAMQEFELCGECGGEFRNTDDRRFHAQTNACPSCGPALWVTDPVGEISGRDGVAIQSVVESVVRGGIVAIKGVGGYQLLCDATSSDTVDRLRQRKQRQSNPLAVMLDDRFVTGLSVIERAEFRSAANPIVLVLATKVTGLAANIAPGLDTVGIMRPTTPLHWMLLNSANRPLVVTSGNVEGEPLAFENDEAQKSLGSVADVMLHHDRPIVRPIDDSVVRIIANRAVTIRAGRGLAPLPLKLDPGRPLLAVGGHQKVAVAFSNGALSIAGPHIGDLGSLAARCRFVAQTRELLELYGVQPEAIAHDAHPDYFTTRWAEEQGVPTIAVQHHHAHVVAGMLEHGWLNRTVLGIAFDGTGLGTDGTIWGGEFLLATTDDFHRVASLRTFTLPGGEQAIRQPWRTALSLLRDACGADVAMTTLQPFVESSQLERTTQLLSRGMGSRTSSLGRLFDAVAAIVLQIRESSFEGELAMRLEAACDPTTDGEYEMTIDNSVEIPRLDWRLLLLQLRDDKAAGIHTGVIAMRFHRAIATAVARVASQFQDYPVVLCGGCFQNRVLTELIAARLASHSQPVGLPGIIPPNDGGLSAGQLAIAQAKLQQPQGIKEAASCA